MVTGVADGDAGADMTVTSFSGWAPGGAGFSGWVGTGCQGGNEAFGGPSFVRVVLISGY
ncbi:hypothetical protein MTP06_53920 [Streptomyces sp. PLM4]|nr:hypothetical protein MTP06_53920 [Streptomyces sp. PLM4]